MVSFLLIVFFVPFLVITASYAVVTARVFSFSKRSSKDSKEQQQQQLRQFKKGSLEDGCCCCCVPSVGSKDGARKKGKLCPAGESKRRRKIKVRQ